MFGPRMTPSGSPPVRSATALAALIRDRIGALAGRERAAGVAQPGAVRAGDRVDHRARQLGARRPVQVGVARQPGRGSAARHLADVECHARPGLLCGPARRLRATWRRRPSAPGRGDRPGGHAAARATGRRPSGPARLRHGRCGAPARQPASTISGRGRAGSPCRARRPGPTRAGAIRRSAAPAMPAHGHQRCPGTGDAEGPRPGRAAARTPAPMRRTRRCAPAAGRPAARPARPRSAGPACAPGCRDAPRSPSAGPAG